MSAVHKEKASSSSLFPVERRLWTPEDLAAYLGVEPGWVYRRTGPMSKKRDGAFREYWAGNADYRNAQDFRGWLERQRRIGRMIDTEG